MGDAVSGLISLIEKKLPKNSKVELYIDIHDKLAERKFTLGQLMVFCANTGTAMVGKAGRWAMPWMTIEKKEESENVHG